MPKYNFLLGFGFVPTYQKESKNQCFASSPFRLGSVSSDRKGVEETQRTTQSISRKTAAVKLEERIAKIKEVQRG